MAIVKLDKISLVGLADDKTQLITALSKLGAVSVEQDLAAEEQLADLSKGMVQEGVLASTFDPESRNIYFPDENSQKWDGDRFEKAILELSDERSTTQLLARLTANEYRKIQIELNRRMQALTSGMATAQAFSEEKKPMFTIRRKVKADDFQAIGRKQNEVFTLLEKLDENRNAEQKLLNKRATLVSQVQQIQAWEKVVLPEGDAEKKLNLMHTFSGSVSNRNENVEKLKAELADKLEGNYAIETLATVGEQSALLVAVREQDAAEAEKTLRSFEFAALPKLPVELGQNYGKAVKQWRTTLAELEIEEKRLEEEAKRLSKNKADFELLYDYYLNADAKLEAMQRLLNTGRLFVLQGYVPHDMSHELKAALEEEYAVAIDILPVPKDEDHPILLKNNRMVRPYEAVVEMFSLPSVSQDVDPTPVMAPFYAFFFGIMLSDAGYGLLLLILSAVLVYKVKVEGNMRRMCLMFMQGSVAAIIFGVLFGSFFGNMLTEVSGGAINFPMLWFDPVKDPVTLMLASIVFGAVHLFAGLGVKFYNLWRLGKPYEAIVETIPWFLIIVGLTLFGLNYSVGQYMAIVGAIMIVFFSAKGVRNPIKRVFSGLGTLYGIASYLGDLLSYTRILALTLATSVIALVVNMLSSLMGRSLVGIVFMIVILVFGHALNLALSGLSAYVHTTRLQYVEYFGKFYEGGGAPFQPLALKTKYTKIIT